MILLQDVINKMNVGLKLKRPPQKQWVKDKKDGRWKEVDDPEFATEGTIIFIANDFTRAYTKGPSQILTVQWGDTKEFIMTSSLIGYQARYEVVVEIEGFEI